MIEKEPEVWDDLSAGDDFYMLLVPDDNIDAIIDKLINIEPLGIDREELNTKVEVRFVQKPFPMKIHRIDKTEGGYEVGYGKTGGSYFTIPLDLFFTEGAVLVATEDIEYTVDLQEKDPSGVIAFGVTEEIVQEVLEDLIYDSYMDVIENDQYEIDLDDE